MNVLFPKLIYYGAGCSSPSTKVLHEQANAQSTLVAVDEQPSRARKWATQSMKVEVFVSAVCASFLKLIYHVRLFISFY